MAEGLSPQQDEEAAQLFSQAKESADKIIGLDGQIDTLNAASHILNEEVGDTVRRLVSEPVEAANKALTERPIEITDRSHEGVIDSEGNRSIATTQARQTTIQLARRLEARKAPHEKEMNVTKQRASEHYQKNKDAYQEQALADAKEAGHDDITFRPPVQQ